LVLVLLWAAEASAGSRISLLPFEGDRPKPLRWKVAYALKRAGHTVLGYAPPTDRSSVASLRNYADRRNVDLFVSGTSAETAQGWELSLRFRGADGKAVGQPVTFRADSLKGLLAELRNEGPSKLERTVPGGSQPAVAELPAGRALPLPTRRARPSRPKSERPVLPGAPAPEEVADEDPSGASPARGAAPKEVDLDAAAAARSAVARSLAGGSASASGGETWDADAPDTPPPGKGRSRTKDAVGRSTKRASQQRTASGSALFASMAPSQRSESVDLDADTRNALEEAPKSKSRGKSRPSREAREETATTDPAPDPAAAPERAAAEASGDADSFDADAEDPPAPEPRAKPKKKGGLFAGLVRKHTPTADDDAKETTVEDSGSGTAESTLRTPPHAQISGRAGFLHRSLAYSDDLYDRLRAPTTNGWVFRIEANLFPFAKPLKERFSLIGSYEGSLAGTVRDERADRDFDVTFSELQGGARLRFPIGQHEIGTQATIVRTTAGLDAAASASGVPEISYVALRPAADLTMNFGAVSLRGAIGYQRTLGGFGEMSSAEWFPHMDGYGFDSQLGLDYRVSSTVTLQALGSVRRFVLDMNSRPDDAIGGRAEVAGGAVDQYLSGYFGVMFAL
jgi:hypothetical protein